MKNIRFIYIFLLSAILLSCNESFLEREPLDKLSDEAVFKNEALLTQYVNALYDAIPNPYTEGSLAAITDEGYFRYGGVATNYIARGEMTPDNVVYQSEGGPAHNTRMTFLNIWKRAYTNIRSMNIFLNRIDDATVSDKAKKQLKGEVYFLRAWTYANLVWRYSGVPIISEIYSIGDEYTATRANYDDCIAFIVSDIDKALELLPDKAALSGRACADAALALKSRVLLYDASPLFNDPNDPNPSGNNLIFRGVYNIDKWTKAKNAAKAVIDRADAGAYALADDYKNIWCTSNNSEIIWAKFYNNSWLATTPAQVLYAPGKYFGGWLSITPYEQMVCEYEMKETGKLPFEDGSGYNAAKPWAGRDPRFYETIIYPGSIFRDTLINSYKSISTNIFPHGPFYSETIGTGGTGYWLKKWHIESAVISETTNTTLLYPWFRLAEFYLNYAEACLNLGDDATCREYINKVRDRKNVMMLHVTATGNELREKLIHERRVEYAFENQRFFDLRRWKLAGIYENISGYSIEITKQVDGSLTYKIATKGADGKPDYSKCIVKLKKAFSNQFYLQPIPSDEMAKAKGTLIQNPGY